MMAVRFNRAMRPYGAGDTALLPDDVAGRLIAAGEAVAQPLPASPHAHAAGEAIPAPDEPSIRRGPGRPPKLGYLTK